MNVLQEEVTACNEESDNERERARELEVEEAGGGCAPYLSSSLIL